MRGTAPTRWGARKGHRDLPAHQDDAGCSLLARQPGDIQLTAQVLEFIVDARKAGLAVDDTVATRAPRRAASACCAATTRASRRDYRWNQQVTAILRWRGPASRTTHYLSEIFNNASTSTRYSLAEPDGSP